MNDQRIAIATELMDLERELRVMQLWSAEAPTAEALKSVEPFAVDTLTLPEWLQYIFLPKIKVLLENDQQLPKACNILPMAQIFFQQSRLDTTCILAILHRVDILMEGAPKDTL